MKISPINSFQVPQYKKEVKQNSSVKNFPQNNPINPLGYNDYLLSFGARVDKGLERFYDTNKDRMPQTVRDYIENLDDKSKYSPLSSKAVCLSCIETINLILLHSNCFFKADHIIEFVSLVAVIGTIH